jgi:hypothetical protein
VLGRVGDVFAIHLMLLYALSILARYRPAVWREVIEGTLDQYSALIVGYADIARQICRNSLSEPSRIVRLS